MVGNLFGLIRKFSREQYELKKNVPNVEKQRVY